MILMGIFAGHSVSGVAIVSSFGANLAKRLGLPIAFWDERLSTAAVTRTLIEADTSRARRAELVDKLAAAFILQGALDRLRAPVAIR